MTGDGYLVVFERHPKNTGAPVLNTGAHLVTLECESLHKLHLEICARIRDLCPCLIVFLAESTTVLEQVIALNRGADDFILSDCGISLLLAKLVVW